MTQTLFLCDDFLTWQPRCSSSTITPASDRAPGRCSRTRGTRSSARPRTAVQALSAVAELHPDLVLLDVQLPDFDGFEIATRLKRNGSPSVVLVSSRDADDFGTMVVECGALGFIPKAELSGEALQRLMK